jgi:hypothetical protein
MVHRLPFALTLFAALPLLATNASAGGVAIGLSAHGQHGSFGVWIGGPAYPAPPCPPRYGGHWETVVERVWVPGCPEQVWVQPLYETRYDPCGHPIQVCVRAGYWTTVQRPGHWEDRPRQVWRPARYGGCR